MRRTLAFACLLFAAALPSSALAAARMFIGFQDDPSLRWREDRGAVFDQAAQANASLVRTTVYWSRIAPQRPAVATDPFDSSYRFDDLDEFVRSAQFRGIEVMLTIWGTPTWANGGKGQNRAPTRTQDLQKAGPWRPRVQAAPDGNVIAISNDLDGLREIRSLVLGQTAKGRQGAGDRLWGLGRPG